MNHRADIGRGESRSASPEECMPYQPDLQNGNHQEVHVGEAHELLEQILPQKEVDGPGPDSVPATSTAAWVRRERHTERIGDGARQGTANESRRATQHSTAQCNRIKLKKRGGGVWRVY